MVNTIDCILLKKTNYSFGRCDNTYCSGY